MGDPRLSPPPDATSPPPDATVEERRLLPATESIMEGGEFYGGTEENKICFYKTRPTKFYSTPLIYHLFNLLYDF